MHSQTLYVGDYPVTTTSDFLNSFMSECNHGSRRIHFTPFIVRFPGNYKFITLPAGLSSFFSLYKPFICRLTASCGDRKLELETIFETEETQEDLTEKMRQGKLPLTGETTLETVRCSNPKDWLGHVRRISYGAEHPIIASWNQGNQPNPFQDVFPSPYCVGIRDPLPYFRSIVQAVMPSEAVPSRTQ